MALPKLVQPDFRQSNLAYLVQLMLMQLNFPLLEMAQPSFERNITEIKLKQPNFDHLEVSKQYLVQSWQMHLNSIQLNKTKFGFIKTSTTRF